MKSARQTGISLKMLPNGNIRAHTNDERKCGVGELQIIDTNNIAPSVITAHIIKIIEYEEDTDIR